MLLAERNFIKLIEINLKQSKIQFQLQNQFVGVVARNVAPCSITAMSKSWVAYPTDSHFPIQNLPYGVFSTAQNTAHRIGVAIGDQVLDLDASARLGLLQHHGFAEAAECFLQQSTLNVFMSKGSDVWSIARKAICN